MQSISTIHESDFVLVNPPAPQFNTPRDQWDRMVCRNVQSLSSMQLFKKGGEYLYDGKQQVFTEVHTWNLFHRRHTNQHPIDSTSMGLEQVRLAVLNTLTLVSSVQALDQSFRLPLSNLQSHLEKAIQAIDTIIAAYKTNQVATQLFLSHRHGFIQVCNVCEGLLQRVSSTHDPSPWMPVENLFPVPFPDPMPGTKQFEFNQTFSTNLTRVLDYITRQGEAMQQNPQAGMALHDRGKKQLPYSIMYVSDQKYYILFHIPLKQQPKPGQFKVVELAYSHQHKYVVKLLHKKETLDDEYVINLEKTHLSKIKDHPHPSIAQIFDLFYNEREFIVFAERCKRDLKEAEQEFWNNREKIHKLALEILTGLTFLHDELHIVHLDLKPANILMDNDNHAKIIDFGFARQKSEPLIVLAGTPMYIAPEILIATETKNFILVADGKMDVFAMGPILYGLIHSCEHRKLPWAKRTLEELKLVYRKQEHLTQFREPDKEDALLHASWQAIQLPANRPTAKELLQKLKGKDGKSMNT